MKNVEIKDVEKFPSPDGAIEFQMPSATPQQNRYLAKAFAGKNFS